MNIERSEYACIGHKKNGEPCNCMGSKRLPGGMWVCGTHVNQFPELRKGAQK